MSVEYTGVYTGTGAPNADIANTKALRLAAMCTIAAVDFIYRDRFFDERYDRAVLVYPLLYVLHKPEADEVVPTRFAAHFLGTQACQYPPERRYMVVSFIPRRQFQAIAARATGKEHFANPPQAMPPPMRAIAAAHRWHSE